MLGCGEWSVGVYERGGATLLDVLDVTSMSCGRTLNDWSAARIVSPVCDPCVDITPWEHEVQLLRDGRPEWIGVPAYPDYSQTATSVQARDLGTWLDHRRIEFSMGFTEDDLAFIFRALFEAALVRDSSPNLSLNAQETGINLSRTFNIEDHRMVGEELRSLVANGIDYTFHLRELKAGPPGTVMLDNPLLTEHLDDPHITSSGPSVATEAVVLGLTDEIEGMAGGVSARYGLVQTVLTSQSRITDDLAAADLAREVVRDVSSPPQVLTGRLLPDAPFSFSELVPGALITTSVQAGCRSAEGAMRLVSVDVSVGNDETVDVELVSV